MLHLSSCSQFTEALCSSNHHRVALIHLAFEIPESVSLSQFTLSFQSLHVEHFTCVVKMLYNLQFTQGLAAMSTKFSSEERQARVTSGALAKVQITIMQWNLHIHPSFVCYDFYLCFSCKISLQEFILQRSERFLLSYG